MIANTKTQRKWRPSEEIKRLPRAGSITLVRESDKAEEYTVALSNGRNVYVWIPKSVEDKEDFVAIKLKELEESATRIKVLEERGNALKVHFMDSDIYIPKSLPITEVYDGTVAIDEYAEKWILTMKFVRIGPLTVVSRKEKSILVKHAGLTFYIPLSRVHTVNGSEYIERSFFEYLQQKALE